MRVNPNSSPLVQGSDVAAGKAADTKKSEKLKAAYEGSSDAPVVSKKSDSSSAEISSKAKDMAKAKQIATDAPDVREAKIAELRDKIQNKKYDVSASAISDRLVDDHLRMGGA